MTTPAGLGELLPWGLTWEHLTGYARLAAQRHWSRFIDYAERYDAALGGITMAVSESDLPPSRRDMLIAGAVAITEAVQAARRNLGLPTNLGEHQGDGRRFAMYWKAERCTERSFTDEIDERLAVFKVWGALGARDQETLWAISTYGDDQAAADALGITRSAYASRLMHARRRARELWHDWEPDPGHFGRGTRRRRPDTTYYRLICNRVKAHKQRRQRRAA